MAEGAPDSHTRAGGLLMLAGRNEQVARLNDAVQAARAGRGQLGQAAAFALPGGRQVSFHIGDQVLIRRSDHYQQATTGEAVLNGCRGVVTDIMLAGVAVAWR
jgi:hypothetical protein